MTSVVLGATRTHLRQQGLAPLAWVTTALMPICFAWILHVRTGESGLRLVAAVSAAGMIDTVGILVVLTVLSERQWNTLEMAAAAPGGIAPILAGRLAGIVTQILPTIAVSYVFVQLTWGGVAIERPLPSALAVVVLAMGVVVVMVPLAAVLLRFRFSAGMTNGIPALLLAVSGALIPVVHLPPTLRASAEALPITWAVSAIEAGDWGDLGTALVLVVAWAAVGTGLVYVTLRGMRTRPDAYRT